MGIAGLTALQAVRDHGELQPGERVLINGASGGVGTLTDPDREGARRARHRGRAAPRNVEQARALGADHVRRLHARGLHAHG